MGWATWAAESTVQPKIGLGFTGKFLTFTSSDAAVARSRLILWVRMGRRLMDSMSAVCQRAVICVADIAHAEETMLGGTNCNVFMTHGDVFYPPLALIS